MILLLCSLLWAEEKNHTTVIQEELERNLSELGLPNQERPYYIGAYTVSDEVSYAKARFGALMENINSQKNRLYVDLRVGSSVFDNRNFDGGFATSKTGTLLPSDASPALYQKKLWLLCDQAYKGAIEEFSEKKAAYSNLDTHIGIDLLPIKVEQDNRSRSIELRDLSPLVTRLSRYSPKGWEDLNVSVMDRKRDIHFLSTEKSDIQKTERYSVLHLHGVRKTADGSDVVGHRWWVAPSPREFPTEEGVRQEMTRLKDWLLELQKAPVEEDYLGPVLFEPAAAAEFFRQLLPKQISGSPPKSEAPNEWGGTSPVSAAREGRRIFDGNWNVEDLPQKQGLLGSYQFDYEGVKAQNMTLIKKGVVHDLLMSRTPRKGKTKSTGHGRGGFTSRTTAMPSNVLVTPPKRYKMAKIRKKAIKMSRQAGNKYVLVVRVLTPLELDDSLEIAFSGDSPLSGLSKPLEMVRLYENGTEEAVRSGEFFGVDRRILRDIVMAGPQSSWIHMIDAPPSDFRANNQFVGYGTSWSAPAILISEMELRGSKGGEKHRIPEPE